MADLPISGLPAAGALAGTEPLAIVQGGTTKKTTVQAVANLVADELTSDELAAINGANSPDATNVFLTEDDEVYVKDANDNVFYKGVTATLGTGCTQNTFHQGSATLVFGDGCTNNIVEQECNGITLGDSCGANRFGIACGNLVLGDSSGYNTFEQGSSDITIGIGCENNIFELYARNIIFGDGLAKTTVKSGNYATLDLTASPTFNFLYSLAYPSEIYLGLDGNPYHQYYDGANNRFVITLLISPYTVSYIGAGSTVTDFTDLGDVPSSYTGQANKVVSVKNDETGLEFTTPSGGGDAYLANDQTFTGENTFDIPSGNDTPVTITKGGNNAALKVTKSSGNGDAIEVAEGSLSIADETASTIAIFDANKRVKSGDTSTYPSLTEIEHVKGVTAAIQTQFTNINNRLSNLIDIATDGAATSGTSNTYSTGGLITPDQILAGDAIEIFTLVRKSATNGTVTIRLYANTTNDLAGSPILIGASSALASGTRQAYFTRWLRIKVKDSTGAGTEVQNTSSTVATDQTQSTSAPSTLAIDWTVNQYLIVAIQNANGSDSSVSTMFKARR
jgi:hypothetical protein